MHPVTPSNLNAANALTVLRLAAVPVFVWLFATQGTTSLAAGAVFLAAAATDKLDGTIARKYNLITRFGKLADPIADKALVGAALVCLSLFGQIAWWATALVLAREVAVTLLRMFVLRTRGEVVAASRGGKTKTAAQTAALACYLLPVHGYVTAAQQPLLALAVAVTVWTGAEYCINMLKGTRAVSSEGAASSRPAAD